jgi:hypothetical protein
MTLKYSNSNSTDQKSYLHTSYLFIYLYLYKINYKILQGFLENASFTLNVNLENR